MGDIVLMEGDNRLDVQMVRIPPALRFIEFYWDETPPFQAPSQHQFGTVFENLRPFDFTFQAEIYVNGELFKTKSIRALGDQTSVIIDWYTFSTAGTYTVTVKALYDGLLLDQISSTVTVTPPAPIEVIDGQFRQFHVRWEDEIYWWDLRSTNSWPADKLMIIKVSVLNTGNVIATFRIAGMPDTVSLAPGEYDIIDVPPFYAVEGMYMWVLYADGKRVDEVSFSVMTY